MPTGELVTAKERQGSRSPVRVTAGEAPGAVAVRPSARVLLVDDHAIVRRGVRSLLQADARWEVCGEAVNGKDAVSKAKRLRPDVVLLDLTMPDLNGLEATRQILQSTPRTRILIFTMHDSEQLVREVLNAGALGYVLKSEVDRDLVAGLEAITDGRVFFGRQISQMVLRGYLRAASGNRGPAAPGRLTQRQAEVVALLAQGKSNKEVAAQLGITVKTAETHRTNIMRRLEFHSFSDLVRYAIREKLIEP